MRDHDRIVLEITEALDAYYAAYSGRDLEALARAVVQDDSLIAFGTDREETWLGWDEAKGYIRAQLRAFSEVRFERKALSVKVAEGGEVAWFCELTVAQIVAADERMSLNLRMSGVFVHTAEGWKLAHFHRSVPVKDVAVPYPYPGTRVPVRW